MHATTAPSNAEQKSVIKGDTFFTIIAIVNTGTSNSQGEILKVEDIMASC
jgi:hypothetical protein